MGQTDMANVVDRLKVLLESSTPIVVMETVEEVRAVRLVRVACSAVNLATFEWSIASGLMRSGATSTESGVEARDSWPHQANNNAHESEQNTKALYNSREPAQMLEVVDEHSQLVDLTVHPAPEPLGLEIEAQ